MNYSIKTQKLIDRMCRNVERKDFELKKKEAEELILKTYDLFNLKRPKKCVWLVDIFDNKFQKKAGSARSARSAWSAWSALDYDFDWFIFGFEYCNNREKNSGMEPNENDYKYLEYSELLMQAKEAGLGYRVEEKNVLYLVPTPLVLMDENNRYHSEVAPAIRWKQGEGFYFLHGISFDKTLWEKLLKNP